MMDILKRIDQAQQFCKFYADGAYSVETAQWSHHVNPEFIEDIRQYIESLQLKLMHLQTQQAHRAVCKSESYDMLDRFLRNNLYDDDYESYSEALDEIASTPPRRKPLTLWTEAQHERAYRNSPELHKDVKSLAAFKRVAKEIAAMYGIKENT